MSRITVVPAVAEVITTVQDPVPPEVVQVDGPTKLPGPDAIAKLITVPSGAFTKPPTPVLTFTCPVSVWFVPTGFEALAGLIWMFASTQFFVAFPELPFAPSVSRCSRTPLTVTSVAACTTVTPGVADVITTVQEPVPPDVVQLVGPTNEPGPDTMVKLITVPSGAFTKPAPVGFTFT